MQKENHCKQKNEIEFISGQKAERINNEGFRKEYFYVVKNLNCNEMLRNCFFSVFIKFYTKLFRFIPVLVKQPTSNNKASQYIGVGNAIANASPFLKARSAFSHILQLCAFCIFPAFSFF